MVLVTRDRQPPKTKKKKARPWLCGDGRREARDTQSFAKGEGFFGGSFGRGGWVWGWERDAKRKQAPFATPCLSLCGPGHRTMAGGAPTTGG
jgi:hypothetical protein